jgi:ABC-type multidrug transport system fused ATPase/permease subunit
LPFSLGIWHDADGLISHKGLLSLLGRDWLRWLLAVSGAVLDALLGLLLPRALSNVMGSSVRWLDYAELAGVLLARASAVWLAGTMVRSACETLAERLRSDLFRAMLSRDIADYDDGSAVERWTLLNNDVREYKVAVGRLVSDGVPALVTVAAGSFMLYSTSPLLTTVLGLTAPIVLGGGAWLARQLRARLQRVRELEAQSVSDAADVLQHIRTVRIYATEPEEQARHDGKLAHVSSEYMWLQRYLVAFHAASGMALTGLSAAGLFLGYWWSGGQQVLDAKSLTAYLMGALRVQGAVASLSLLVSETWRVIPQCGERIFGTLQHIPRIPIGAGGRHIAQRASVDIEWRDVDFAYVPATPVLRKLTLSVKVWRTKSHTLALTALINRLGSLWRLWGVAALAKPRLLPSCCACMM